MAGSVDITYKDHGPVRWVRWSWTSDGSGDVSGTDTGDREGEILRWVTNPGATAPSANYDIVVNDEDGVDVAVGVLGNRHTSTSEQAVGLIGDGSTTDKAVFFVGKLSLVVSNAGSAKEGVLTMFYR